MRSGRVPVRPGELWVDRETDDMVIMTLRSRREDTWDNVPRVVWDCLVYYSGPVGPSGRRVWKEAFEWPDLTLKQLAP